MRAALLAIAICTALAAPDDPVRGRDAFERRCTGCHTLEKIKLGPPLRGVYGKKAGSDPYFEYSDALKKSTLVWTGAALDRWLTDTDSLIPGNDMAFRLNDPAERAAIVAYLRELSSRRRPEENTGPPLLHVRIAKRG